MNSQINPDRQSIDRDPQKNGNFVTNLLLDKLLFFSLVSWITRNAKLSEIGWRRPKPDSRSMGW